MSRVIKHALPRNPFTGEGASGEIREFLFPVERSQIPRGIELPVEFEGYASLGGAAVRKELLTKWSSARHDVIKMFARLLRNFSPVSLIQYEDEWALRLSLRDVEDYRDLNNFYLPSPVQNDEIEQILEELGSDANSSIAEFLHLFGGLSEIMPPGHSFAYDEYVRCEEVGYIDRDDYIEEYDVDDLDEWQEGLVLYSAKNGDMVVLRSSGETAWYCHEGPRIEALTAAFDSFVARYCVFVSMYLGAFTSFTATAPAEQRSTPLIF